MYRLSYRQVTKLAGEKQIFPVECCIWKTPLPQNMTARLQVKRTHSLQTLKGWWCSSVANWWQRLSLWASNPVMYLLNHIKWKLRRGREGKRNNEKNSATRWRGLDCDPPAFSWQRNSRANAFPQHLCLSSCTALSPPLTLTGFKHHIQAETPTCQWFI